MLPSVKVVLLLCVGSVLRSQADDCDVGTVDDTCVAANGDEEVKSRVFVGCNSCTELYVPHRDICKGSLVHSTLVIRQRAVVKSNR